MLSTVYLKTELGRRALKERSVGLTQRQRSAFILFDGQRTLADVLAAVSGLGVTADDVIEMAEHGYLIPTHNVMEDTQPFSALASSANQRPVPVSAPARDAIAPTMPAELVGRMTPSQERFHLAYPIAAQLTSGLGLRGFRLHLAVESANNYEQLLRLVPRIRAAVGAQKCRALDQALDH